MGRLSSRQKRGKIQAEKLNKNKVEEIYSIIKDILSTGVCVLKGIPFSDGKTNK
jgi:hypothetical protein